MNPSRLVQNCFSILHSFKANAISSFQLMKNKNTLNYLIVKAWSVIWSVKAQGLRWMQIQIGVYARSPRLAYSLSNSIGYTTSWLLLLVLVYSDNNYVRAIVHKHVFRLAGKWFSQSFWAQSENNIDINMITLNKIRLFLEFLILSLRLQPQSVSVSDWQFLWKLKQFGRVAYKPKYKKISHRNHDALVCTKKHRIIINDNTREEGSTRWRLLHPPVIVSDNMNKSQFRPNWNSTSRIQKSTKLKGRTQTGQSLGLTHHLQKRGIILARRCDFGLGLSKPRATKMMTMLW